MISKNYTQTRHTYPRTMDEFLDQGWDKKIKNRFATWNFRDSVNNPDDLLQDILAQLIETNYLKRYDPEKRVFEVYLFEFVSNFLKKRYLRENTRYGKYITSASALVYTSSDEESYGRTGETYIENLDMFEDDTESKIAIKIATECLAASLKAEFKASSCNTLPDGTVVPRDPATLLKYLLEDFSIKEVAEKMDVSSQFLYSLRNKIRLSDEGEQLRQVLMDLIYS